MSAAEKLIPDPRAEELARIRQRYEAETRDWPTIRAMAIAKGRGETYSRERHGPFDLKAPPKLVRTKDHETDAEAELEALLDRFRAKGSRLPAVPNAEREGVRRVREL